MDDREPQPSDGPDYHADHDAWERRQPFYGSGTQEGPGPAPEVPPTYVTKSGRVLTDADIEVLADEAERGYDLPKLDRSKAKHRGGIVLPEDCWEWLRTTADHDGSSRDDLIEGLVLLAMDGSQPPGEDEAHKARLFDGMATMVMDHWSEDIIEGGLPEVVQRVFEHRDALREALTFIVSHLEPCDYRNTYVDREREKRHWTVCVYCRASDALEPYGRPG